MKHIVNQKILNLFGHGVFYTFAMSIESIAPFLLAPFLTRFITVYEYGIWAIFQAATAFLRPLIGLALDDFVRIRYNSHSREHMAGYLIAIITLSGALSLILCTLTMLFGEPLSELLHFPSHWLWAIIICAWIYALFYMLLAFYQFESQRTRYAIIHVTQALGTLAFTVALVLLGYSWTGAVMGKMLGLLSGTLLAWWWIMRYFPESALTYFRFSYIIELLSFSKRYLASGMLIVVIIFTDRIMLANMVGVEESSLFAVASLFPMVLLIAIHGYVYGWQPWCFKRLARKQSSDTRELFIGAALFFIFLPIGGVILNAVAAWLGPYMIGADYGDAFTYVPALTTAMVMQGCYLFSKSILQFYQKLTTLSVIAVITMIVNVIGNYILIARMGTLGSCYATAIAYGTGFILVTAVASIQIKQYITSLTQEQTRV